MEQGTQFRIRGRVADGMFSHERVFNVEGADGREICVIVPRTDIDDRNGDATVRVVVLGSSGDLRLVSVPGEPFETGQTVWVPDRELIPA